MGNSILARGLRKLRKKKNREKKAAARHAYIDYLLTLPVDEKLCILEARNGRAIDGNIYYILRELLSGPEYQNLKLYLVSENESCEAAMRRKLQNLPEATARITFVRLRSEDYYRVMACAGFIVNDATIGNFFIKKEGQVYLNTWHGTPLKTMGRKVTHEPHAAGNVQKNFIVADYLLYPSDYMMEHMVEDYMLAGISGAQVLMGGYPRNSVFFDEVQRQAVRSRIASEGEKIYAYMPTWRPSLVGSELDRVLSEIDAELESGETMFVNVHPLAEESVDFSRYSRIRRFPEDIENYALLNAADALLTDYSSVFYDFAVTRRKIVLLTYDEEEYFAARGLYEPISALPFPQVKTVREAMEELRSPVGYEDEAFLRKYCRYEGADAAKVLCREVFAGECNMEHRSIPGGGRNVLVYGGDLAPGARTDEVLRYLADPDKPEANYLLTFNRKDLEERSEILLHLPEGINYIGRAGNMLLSSEEQAVKDRYEKGSIPFEEYWEKVRPAFARERKRFYGDMRIDEIKMIPEGKSPGPDASKEELEFSTYQ